MNCRIDNCPSEAEYLDDHCAQHRPRYVDMLALLGEPKVIDIPPGTMVLTISAPPTVQDLMRDAPRESVGVSLDDLRAAGVADGARFRCSIEGDGNGGVVKRFARIDGEDDE